VLLCAGLGLALGVSFLIAAVTMGVVVANLAAHHTRPFHEIEGIEWPFLVVFFVLAGASLELEALEAVSLLAAGYIVLRTLGKILGSWIGGILAGLPALERRWLGFGMLPQAGVALGLALLVEERFPEIGVDVLPIVVVSTVFFELVGPVLTRMAVQQVPADHRGGASSSALGGSPSGPTQRRVSRGAAAGYLSPVAAGDLQEYRGKRDLDRTPEPAGGGGSASRFVIHEHDASTHHWDLRLEAGDVLKCWAVPKGPSTDPRERRLAVATEDHPVDYLDFEGTIPEDEYGAGRTIVWDTGTYENRSRDDDGAEIPLEDAVESGHVSVWLDGEKLRGGWALTRFRGADNWLLVKKDDEGADARRNPTSTQPGSVQSGRTVSDLPEPDEPAEPAGDQGEGGDGE
jgi:DNA ligase D-like protein (predicted 3'-phosphoesterase)